MPGAKYTESVCLFLTIYRIGAIIILEGAIPKESEDKKMARLTDGRKMVEITMRTWDEDSASYSPD